MKYYVDTCMWIDFFEGRTHDDIFIKCVNDEDIIIYSYPLEKELLKYIDIKNLRSLYSLLSSKGLIQNINVTEDEKSEAYNISAQRKIPFADALHAIMARDNQAILLTRDKHFLKLKDICNIELF